MATFPLVTSIVRAVPLSQSTSATSVSYTVTFDEAVTGVNASDFQLTETNGNLQAQTPVVVTGSGTTYTVQVNGLRGSGDLRLDLIDDDSIEDLSNDPLGGLGAGNGSFQGPTYAIDQADPVVLSIDGAAPALGTPSASSLSYTVTFSEAVSGVNLSDFVLATTGTAAGTVTQVTPVSTSVYDVTVAGITGVGSLGLNLVDNGTIHDLAGNPLGQAGAATFAPQATFATGSGPTFVALGDVNGDGNADIVVANSGSSNVGVLLGNGDGTFLSPAKYPSGSSPFAVAVADVNGDGILDIVVANTGSKSVGVLLGNGDGTFKSEVTYATGSEPIAVAVADLNGDGKPDIVVANAGSDTVSVLMNNGNGTFALQAAYPTGSAPSSVAVADLTGDGTPDIVVANTSDDTVSVLLGNGDGTFAPQVTYATGFEPDRRGRGGPSPATASPTSSPPTTTTPPSVCCWATATAPSQPQATTYATGSAPNSVAVADLNGDGKPDLVVANAGDNTVGVLPNNGDGTFAPQVTYATGSIPSSVAMADVNGDGKTDLVVANFGDDTVSVLDNNSNGNFAGQLYSGDFTDQLYTLVEPTTTAVASSLSPSTYGQSVTFSATVTAGGDPVTDGSVTFSEGTTVLASAVPLDGDGQASFSISTLSAAGSPHLISATYNGSSSNATSFETSTGIASQAVNPALLTVTGITGLNKVYDGTTKASINTSSAALAGVLFGDLVTLDTSGATANFAGKNVGTSVLVSVGGLALAGIDSGDYTLVQPTTSASITQRSLTVSATGINKVYDGTTAANVTFTDNRVVGDVFTDAGTTLPFNDKNVGTGKVLTVIGITITGSDAGNYFLANTTATTSASITPRVLTVSAGAANKVYDGTTAAIVALSDNRVAGDVFTDADTSANFADKNVGNGKAVTVAGITITGTNAGNYTLTSTTATTAANITPRALTVSATGVNKVYDGTTAATVALADNRVGGDNFTDADSSASFTDKNVGNGKAVTVAGITITGTNAGNYTLTSNMASTTANITPRTLTVSATGNNKIYDGTTAATVTLADNRVAGDSFTDADASATFTDKNVGNGKAVTAVGISIAGTDAGNYSLASTTATTAANITLRTLTVSATAIGKVYDGTTAATVTLTDNRVAGDSFTDSDTAAAFTDKNVGNGKAVTVAGIAITGTDAGN